METVDYDVSWPWIIFIFVVIPLMYLIPFPNKEMWRKSKLLYVIIAIVVILAVSEFYFSIFEGVFTFVKTWFK
jgi:hypothetical protein